jgi:hypothetical protein
VSRRFLRRLGLVLAGVVVWGAAASAQQSPPPGASLPPEPTAQISTVVDQIAQTFPKVKGEVVEVQDAKITVDVGRKDGVNSGLELNVVREGREIKHPRTGQVLGRAEQPVGRIRVVESQETLSIADVVQGADIKPGDRVATSPDKVRIVLLPLYTGVREGLVETALRDVADRLGAAGFQVSMGDAATMLLRERNIGAEEFLEGTGVSEVQKRFKFDNILALHFKRVQNRPFMDVRFFAGGRPEALVSSAFFVPASIRAAAQRGGQFSASGRTDGRPEARPRSLLERLLGIGAEPGSYSSAEGPIKLKEIAKFPFPVLAMDIVTPRKDNVPRMVVSDGEKIYLYRVGTDRKVEGEWSTTVRGLGRVFSVHLVDVDGDGVLEVTGNRYHPELGVSGFILGARDGKPRMLVDDIPEFLFGVDTKGEGYKQTLWTQRYSPEHFFTPGQVEQAAVKDSKLVYERQVRVTSNFRPMGATFSNVMGKGTWSLAYIDPRNRLQIANEREDLWRSSTAVGGGYMTVEQKLTDIRGGRSRFFKIEPTPLAVDLDNDGIDELVVPQNTVKEGVVAVIFRGPAGLRLQSVDTGFEGGITALGAFKHPEDVQPTLVVSMVRFSGFIQSILKFSGETQIIMTMPQE